jgi:hypothetical protein
VVLHYSNRRKVLPANIRLRWKWLIVTKMTATHHNYLNLKMFIVQKYFFHWPLVNLYFSLKALVVLHYSNRRKVLPANIRLRWKWLIVTKMTATHHNNLNFKMFIVQKVFFHWSLVNPYFNLKALEVLHYSNKLLVLPANIRLGLKWLILTNW